METEPKVLILGDDINTDDITPAKRCTNGDPEHLKRYAFEYLIGEGNLLAYEEIEAGRMFGCGSGRELLLLLLKRLALKKYALGLLDIFFTATNNVNIGLPLEIISDRDKNPVVEAIATAGGLIPFNQKRQKGEFLFPKVRLLLGQCL